MVKKILDWLNQLAFWFQQKYMSKNQTNEWVNLHQAFFHRHDNSWHILTKFWHQLDKKIVLATGCFDILHQAHKEFLKKAKKQGDVLIVGLETDHRIHELKGAGRPANQLKNRIENLAQTGIADLVFSLPENFSTQKDYLNFLKKVQPDILAVSSSTPNLGTKRKLMKRIGGKLKVVLKHNPQISTTKILSQT